VVIRLDRGPTDEGAALRSGHRAATHARPPACVSAITSAPVAIVVSGSPPGGSRRARRQARDAKAIATAYITTPTVWCTLAEIAWPSNQERPSVGEATIVEASSRATSASLAEPPGSACASRRASGVSP